MPTFTVSGDITFPFVTSVEAGSAEEAEDLVAAQHPLAIPYDTSVAGALVSVDDVIPDEPASPAPVPASPVDEILSLLNGSGVTSNNPTNKKDGDTMSRFKIVGTILEDFEVVIEADSEADARRVILKTPLEDLRLHKQYEQTDVALTLVSVEPEVAPYNVTGTVTIEFTVKVDAESAEAAVDLVRDMSLREIQRSADVDEETVKVLDDAAEPA
jgi:hypothetical protein